METKNEINKLAEMIQREFEVARNERENMKSEMGGMKNEMGSIKSEMGGMKNEIGGMKSEIGSIKSEMGSMKSEMDEKFNLILNSQDAVLKSLGNLETDNTMGAGASRRQEDKLENHEGRIVLVEEKLGIGEAI